MKRTRPDLLRPGRIKGRPLFYHRHGGPVLPIRHANRLRIQSPPERKKLRPAEGGEEKKLQSSQRRRGEGKECKPFNTEQGNEPVMKKREMEKKRKWRTPRWRNDTQVLVGSADRRESETAAKLKSEKIKNVELVWRKEKRSDLKKKWPAVHWGDAWLSIVRDKRVGGLENRQRLRAPTCKGEEAKLTQSINKTSSHTDPKTRTRNTGQCNHQNTHDKTTRSAASQGHQNEPQRSNRNEKNEVSL